AVIVDEAWSKRSCKSNYNALSGVGCIIGARTKNEYYMDVKNRLCLTYKRKKPRQINKEHKCFMNWNKIATAMESNIILKRLQKSLTTHNLIYGKIIDGDSSVYKKL
ncbi:hypothetical protein BDFB_014569, partial [Asbolus verrucosus]